MDTLIELYDERTIENILAPDMFRPKRIVYLCPQEIAQDRVRQDKLRAFFRRRGWNPELIFIEVSLFKADRILRQLISIGEKYPGCALDVTGGSDAALFAAGMFTAQTGTPAFTYSRKKNRFYDISGAAFADDLICNLTYSVEDFFLMAGGTLLPGRVDNAILTKYLKDFDPFFACFLRFRRDWTYIISYIQRVSPSEYGQTPPLSIQGKYTVKGERGSKNSANEAALRQLVRYDIRKGAAGFYVTGSTGEAFLMTTDERKKVMEVIRDEADGKTLIAHVGSVREGEAMELARHAKALGFDAVSSVAPFYYKYSFPEIRDYYFRLADTAQLPLLVYHIPVFSGVAMGTGELSQFLGDGRCLGIKYTSNDFFTMEQCKSRFPDKVLYNGYDEMFLAGLSMGADGGIGSTYNFMADKFVRIKALFEAGDIAAAQKIQQEANRIITVLCQVGVMQAEKEIMNQLGLDFGVCRHPFGELTEDQKQLLRTEVLPYI